MGGNSSAYIVATMLISLFISSFFISYFAINMYGYDLKNTIDLPNSIESYSSEQNFITGAYNASTLDKTGNTGWTYYKNVGMVLTTLGALTNYFLIDNINVASDNTVTNYYVINNSVKSDYTIVLRYTGGYDTNEIEVKSDGFHVPYYYPVGNIRIGDNQFIPLAEANKYTDVVIQTNYYDGDKNTKTKATCIMIFNGVTYEFNNMFWKDKGESEFYGSIFYGGVKSETLGFAFKSFKTDSIIAGSGSNDSGSIAMIASLIKTMLALVVWGLPEQIMPLTLQLLLIRTQEAVLLIGIAGFIRGI